jgi:hypothetical protein
MFTWRSLRHALDRMHLVTFTTADARVAQRSVLTDHQKTILAALDLPEPPSISTADRSLEQPQSFAAPGDSALVNTE